MVRDEAFGSRAMDVEHTSPFLFALFDILVRRDSLGDMK